MIRKRTKKLAISEMLIIMATLLITVFICLVTDKSPIRDTGIAALLSFIVIIAVCAIKCGERVDFPFFFIILIGLVFLLTLIGVISDLIFSGYKTFFGIGAAIALSLGVALFTAFSGAYVRFILDNRGFTLDSGPSIPQFYYKIAFVLAAPINLGILLGLPRIL